MPWLENLFSGNRRRNPGVRVRLCDPPTRSGSATCTPVDTPLGASPMNTKLTLIVLLLVPTLAHAQRRARSSGFGENRSSLFSRGASSGTGSASDAARAATEGQRFSRGQRGRNTFVGSDRADVTTFVGNEQARTQGSVTSSVSGLREQTQVRVNQPRAAAGSSGRYEARISLAPSFLIGSGPRPLRGATSPQRRLSQFFAEQKRAPIAVSVANRAVTLRGQVQSAREKRIAGLIASFEPGVDAVRNDLTVSSVPPTPPSPTPIFPSSPARRR